MSKSNQYKPTGRFLSYFIMIILILFLAGVVVYQFRMLGKMNSELKTESEKLIEKYDETINIIQTDSGKQVIVQTEGVEGKVISEVEAMRLFNEQFNAFKSDWQTQITMFTILVSIFTILVPVFNYVFVVKDQLCSYQKKFDKIKDDFEAGKKKAIKKAVKELDKKYIEVEDKLKEQEKNLRVLISEATRLSQKDTRNEAGNDDLPEKNTLALSIRASMEFNRNNYKTAADLFTEAIELEPENAEYYDNRGVVYHEMKRYDEALKDKTKAVELEPENAEYYYSRGVTYHAMKRYDEALKDKTKAIELEPENALYYNNRGAAYHEMKRYDEALRDSTKAIELEPKNAKYYDNRGMTYQWMKRYDEALKDSTKAIELEPKNAEYLASYAFSLFKNDRYTDSVLAINKSIKLDADSGYAYRTRGRIELKNAKLNGKPCPENVIDDLNHAILIDGKSPWAASNHYLTRAEYYLYVGEDEKAFADLLEALRLNDQNEYAYFYLSQYWERKGDKEEAKKNYDKAVELGYFEEPDQ